MAPSISFSGRCAVEMFLCHSPLFYFPPNVPVQHLSLQKYNSLSPSSDTFKAKSALVMVSIQFLCWFFPAVPHPEPMGLIGNRNRNDDQGYCMSDHTIRLLVRSFLCFTSPCQSTNQKRGEHAIQDIISVQTNMQA